MAERPSTPMAPRALGRLVTELQNEWLGAGTHSVIWNARDRSSGLYFAVLRQADKQDVRKMLLLK